MKLWRRVRQTKVYTTILAIMLAVISTVMILGIQVSFNQNDVGAKITAPIVCVGLVAILFIFKFIRKQGKANFIIANMEKKGKKASPYMVLFFAYFDYMLVCGILSVICGIISGILTSVYQTIRFESLLNWGYTLERMAIVFAIYILCLLIYTVGNMIGYAEDMRAARKAEDQNKTEAKDDEWV